MADYVMPDDPSDARFIPIDFWPREMVCAVALAYRLTLVAGRPEREVGAAARAYIVASGYRGQRRSGAGAP